MKNFKIYPSITGFKNFEWQDKLKEVNELGLKEVAVFVECFEKEERDHLYKFLLKSCIKHVPFVHLRDDTDKSDIEFFVNNYRTQCFNIHEDHFDLLDQWKPYLDKLYLEMNYNDIIPKNTRVREIGGFCIDLSHFKASVARGAEEAKYVFDRKDKIEFKCNHLNGFDEVKMKDKHTVTDLKDFDYLKTLPKFVFGEIIAIEVFNSIKDQLEFKEYLDGMLGEYLG